MRTISTRAADCLKLLTTHRHQKKMELIFARNKWCGLWLSSEMSCRVMSPPFLWLVAAVCMCTVNKAVIHLTPTTLQALKVSCFTYWMGLFFIMMLGTWSVAKKWNHEEMVNLSYCLTIFQVRSKSVRLKHPCWMGLLAKLVLIGFRTVQWNFSVTGTGIHQIWIQWKACRCLCKQN